MTAWRSRGESNTRNAASEAAHQFRWRKHLENRVGFEPTMRLRVRIKSPPPSTTRSTGPVLADSGGLDPQTRRSDPLSRRSPALPSSLSMVRSVGVEPTRLSAAGFEPAASAVSPRPRYLVCMPRLELGRLVEGHQHLKLACLPFHHMHMVCGEGLEPSSLGFQASVSTRLTIHTLLVPIPGLEPGRP